MTHTVEKVSGSSMAAFDEVLDNIIIKPEPVRYNRIVVVPAYEGITDALLECKSTCEPGVYQYILAGGETWESKLDCVIQRLLLVNNSMFADPMLRRKADDFILDRVSSTRQWIKHHLTCDSDSMQNFWRDIRERLASIGETHSAYNTTLKAKRYGVETRFIDLAGDPNEPRESLSSQVNRHLDDLDLNQELPVVTAYASCEVGNDYHDDRRYGDLTLSRIAKLTEAKHAVIHQCSHLSSGDPEIIGAEQVNPIEHSNYQVANELSALSHDLVHPAAIEELSQVNIDLQVKCTFEPEHPGTIISHRHHSETREVEVVTGKEDVCALTIDSSSSKENVEILTEYFSTLPNINLLHCVVSGQTLYYYFDCTAFDYGHILAHAKKRLPDDSMTVQRVALLSVLGTTLDSRQIAELGDQAIESQGIRSINIHGNQEANNVKFVVASAQFKAALVALHGTFFSSRAD